MKYIGIDIGATNLKAGLVDDAGQILAKQKMKIAQIETPDLLARHLARMTEELAAEVGVDLDEIFSIGVGVPGVVEIRSGSLQYSCNLPFRRVPLRRPDVQEAVNRTVPASSHGWPPVLSSMTRPVQTRSSSRSTVAGRVDGCQGRHRYSDRPSANAA